MTKGTELVKNGSLSVWRFLICMLVAYLAYTAGILKQKSGTEEAVRQFHVEKEKIMHKWYNRTCNTADDCRKFLRKYGD
jgi:hypothetical protein